MRVIVLLCVLLFASLYSPAFAAETRGLRVFAKDTATNLTGEVKLYNKSYAVIIGIDKYQYLPHDRQLKYAVKDAKGIEDVLNRLYSFDKIIPIYNEQATRDHILDIFTEELPKQMGEDDALFVFWAGHGNQEKTPEGKLGYLIPYDGNPDKIRTTITMSEIKDTISKKIKAKHVFYVMDACYSGLLTATRAVDNKPQRDLAYLKEITKERVRQVLTAGSEGQEVLDGGRKGHSVFTGRLIEILEQIEDYKTANEIQAIIREKVYYDARARNHEQKPSYGTLYGSGDFVFIRNVAQKLEDNKAELERTSSEIRKLEQQIAEAASQQNEQKRREAEREKEILTARQKIEEERQKQLAREQERQTQLKREQAEFDKKQHEQQEELARNKREEEKKLAKLREQALTVASSGSTTSLEAAVAEIKRLAAEIDTLENHFRAEQTAAELRIRQRYDTLVADIKRQRMAAANQRLVKDQFEDDDDFRQRQQNHLKGYDTRINDLERQKNEELTETRSTLDTTRTAQTTRLRSELKTLNDKEYRMNPSTLVVELGEYNAKKQYFPVTIRNKVIPTAVADRKTKKAPPTASQTPPLVKVAMNGTMPLPKSDAKQFYQIYTGSPNLIRPEITVRPNGDIMKVAIVNDAENYIMEYDNGEFITIAEKKRRQEEAERAEEQERKERAERAEREVAGEFVAVPAGCFTEPEWGGCYTKYSRKTCIDSFRIGKYTVTQGQWRRIMGKNPSYFSLCGDSCPVENVSWNDAQDFISRINSQTGKRYRLPTRAEWKYACQGAGKDLYEYCGSDNIDSVAWYEDNSGKSTHPVGQKQPNSLGIYDMSGNVGQWMQDQTDSGHKWLGNDGWHASNMNCGESWDYSPRHTSEWGRGSCVSPDCKSEFIGFRLASPVQ